METVLSDKNTGPDARNLYQGYDIAFRTEDDFQQFLKDYEGTVFKGNQETISFSGVSVMRTSSCRSTSGTK